MKFKTLRISETGKKFAQVELKADEVIKAAVNLANEIGFETWRPSRWSVYGGVEFVGFKTEGNPDPKIWKNTEHGFQPRKNTHQGRIISEKLRQLPVVSKDELNQCIGYDGAPFKTIGFDRSNPIYFLFETGENWGCKIPEDCEEITVSEYRKLEVKK